MIFRIFKGLFRLPPDKRKNRLVFVIECILNQNARDMGAATYPAMNKKLIHLCMKYDVGIFQIPCPEMACLGFLRNRTQGQSIRDILDTENGLICCRDLSKSICDRIQEYIENNVSIIAVIGGNPESPGCAVHKSPATGTGNLLDNSGVFIKAFHKELINRKIKIPFIGVRDYKNRYLKLDLRIVEKLFQKG